MLYKIEFRKSFNLVGQMEKSSIVNMFKGPDIFRKTIHRAIGECEDKPCLNSPKSGRSRILTEFRAKRLMKSARRKVGVSTRNY